MNFFKESFIIPSLCIKLCECFPQSLTKVLVSFVLIFLMHYVNNITSSASKDLIHLLLQEVVIQKLAWIQGDFSNYSCLFCLFCLFSNTSFFFYQFSVLIMKVTQVILQNKDFLKEEFFLSFFVPQGCNIFFY